MFALVSYLPAAKTYAKRRSCFLFEACNHISDVAFRLEPQWTSIDVNEFTDPIRESLLCG